MGILDRDYMRRRSDDDARPKPSVEGNAEESVSQFLRKHPRFLLSVAIGLGVLCVIALIITTFSGGNR